MVIDLSLSLKSTKISANGNEATADINLAMVEPGLKVPLPAAALALATNPLATQITADARRALELAGVKPEQINRVVLVGGSALMGLIQNQLAALCPTAELDAQNALTAVASGLALAAAD